MAFKLPFFDNYLNFKQKIKEDMGDKMYQFHHIWHNSHSRLPLTIHVKESVHKLCISYRTVEQIAQFHTQHLLNKIKSRNPMRQTHFCTTSLLSYFFGQFIFVSILWYLLFFNTNNNLLKSKWSLPHNANLF